MNGDSLPKEYQADFEAMTGAKAWEESEKKIKAAADALTAEYKRKKVQTAEIMPGWHSYVCVDYIRITSCTPHTDHGITFAQLFALGELYETKLVNVCYVEETEGCSYGTCGEHSEIYITIEKEPS